MTPGAKATAKPADANCRIAGVQLGVDSVAVPDYETLLASRKAAAAAIAGPLQQRSATELVAAGPD